MKCLSIILLCTGLWLNAGSQCLTDKKLWDSIVYLRLSDVPDSIQLKQLQSFIRKAAACGYNKDSVYILLQQRTAALHYLHSNFGEAISQTWQAVSTYNQYAASHLISPALQVKNYFNLYIYYDESGDEQNVAKVVDSCILLSVRTGYADKYTLDALDEKSTSQLETGEYHGCIGTTQLAEYLKKEKPEHYSVEEREKLIRLFSTRLNAMIFLQQYNDAEILLENRKKEYQQLNKGNRLGNWYALMGKLRRRQNRFDETIDLLKRSVSAHLKAGYREGAAESLNNIGYVYLDNLREYNRALPYFQQALQYASPEESMNILSNIGNTYVKLKNFRQAFIAFSQAFDHISPGMNETKLLNTLDASFTANYAAYLIRLEMNKGNAFLSYFKETGDLSALQDAISVYRSADQLLNKIKARQTDFLSKLFWRSDVRQLYEHGIDAAWLANNHTIALYFFEKSRAVLLSDQIHLRKLLSKDEFARYTKVKSAIAGIESAHPHLPSLNAGNEKDLYTYRLQLGEMENKIRERRWKEEQSVVTISEVREKILSKHQGFLEIFTGDSAVYVIGISKSKSVLNKISKPQYDSVLKLFTGLLSDHAALNKNFKQFISVSSQLYALLVGEFEPLAGSMVVSLDGMLFPFEALVKSRNGSAIKYLIEDHPVTYTYNARYFINDAGEGNHTDRIQFTGFAPVNFPAYMNLNPLSGSNLSIGMIGNYFSRSSNYCLKKATRSSFFENYSNSDIILLYTHGAHKSDKNEPALFFSDSALYLSELAGEQRPRTRLIVLAACETGLGANYAGEGVFSFSRGFAAIGIPASITTLWAVNKETTFAVTEHFYKYLSEGYSTDIALQKAKLDLIKKSSGVQSLPYYWAGPVLIGKSDPIVLTHSDSTVWILLVSLLVTGVAAFFAIRRLK